jgi:HEAT repeat protein
MTRTIRSLGFMIGLGVVLASVNAFTVKRDISMATASKSEEQRQFFIGCAARPDMANFYKSLTPEVRYSMAQNIGRYDDPQMAALLGTLLGDFDEHAREALTASLVRLAKIQTKAVAEQLKQKGSFQVIAVTRALVESGVPIESLVAEQLSVGDARVNAENLLVDRGTVSIPALLPKLSVTDNDVKLAAADALGKLRSREAIPTLLTLLKEAKPDQYISYLAAISGIGDPSTEGLLSSVITDETVPIPQRATTAVGLGRIGTPSAIATLWRYSDDPDLQLRQSVIAGLSTAGDRALAAHPTLDSAKLQVATGIQSAAANAVVAQAIGTPQFEISAIQSSESRPELVPVLIQHLAKKSVADDGDVITEILKALQSTDLGQREIAKLKARPEFQGLLARVGA